jgi:SNF2 family DNA or RNA helicase
MKALEALLRLRQAACHRGLLPGASAEVSATSSKVRLLMETLDQVVAEGHRSLIFSQWTSLLDLIEGPLVERGLRFCRLDGSTRNRGDVVAEFQASDGPDVMLLSLKAGGTGLNLTAADHVFLLDPWWNPAVEDQAADRAHRIGQDRPVLVHRIIAAETVEERILGLQERKRAVAEAALGEAAAIGSGITRDEIMELLR